MSTPNFAGLDVQGWQNYHMAATFQLLFRLGVDEADFLAELAERRVELPDDIRRIIHACWLAGVSGIGGHDEAKK